MPYPKMRFRTRDSPRRGTPRRFATSAGSWPILHRQVRSARSKPSDGGWTKTPLLGVTANGAFRHFSPSSTLGSAREWQAGAQAARGRGFEPDTAAMAAGHVARDRQPEPDPAG